MRRGSGQRNKLARLGEEKAASGPTDASSWRERVPVIASCGVIYTRVVPVVDVFPCPETKRES